MNEPLIRETIEYWVSEFCGGDELNAFDQTVREAAQSLLERFMKAACATRGVEPGDVEEADLRHALLTELAPLDIYPTVRPRIPDLCAAFLADLELRGRLSGGAALASFLRALRGAWNQHGAKPVPFVRPGTPVGRNASCPCGSGQKFKKCCMNRLG